MIQNLVLLLSLVSLSHRRIEELDETTIDLQARTERLERLFEDLSAKLEVKQTSETAAKERATTVETTEIAADEKDSCNISFNGICYWTHVPDNRDVDLAKAEEICSNNGSILAYFPNEKVYNSVIEDIRSKIRSFDGWSVDVWTGVTIDTNTGDITHPSEDTYVKWYPHRPATGVSYETWRPLSIVVTTDRDMAYQGMYNGDPLWYLNGAVCQKTIE